MRGSVYQFIGWGEKTSSPLADWKGRLFNSPLRMHVTTSCGLRQLEEQRFLFRLHEAIDKGEDAQIGEDADGGKGEQDRCGQPGVIEECAGNVDQRADSENHRLG
jgi:hypothetical protein